MITEENKKESIELMAEKEINILAEKKAKELFAKQREKSEEMKLFEEKRAQIKFYQENGALPANETVGQLMIKEQMGRQIGLSFMESMQGLGFINGKVAIYGEVMVSQLVKGGVKINFINSSKTSVKVEMTYEGLTQSAEMNIKDWIEKGVVPKPGSRGYYSSPWIKYPEVMLRYKAVRHVAKFLCPHLMGGVPLMEDAKEIENIDDAVISDSNANDKIENALKGFEK